MATPGFAPVSAEIKARVQQDEAVEALAKAHVSIKESLGSMRSLTSLLRVTSLIATHTYTHSQSKCSVPIVH